MKMYSKPNTLTWPGPLLENDICSNSYDFTGVRFKFLARASYIEIGDDTERWCLSDGKCLLCSGGHEYLPHFQFLCPALNHIRLNVFTALEKGCDQLKFEHVWHRCSACS